MIFRFIVLIAIAAVIGWLLLKLFRSGSKDDRAVGDAAAGESHPESLEDAKLVRCVQCGAYVPRGNALPGPEGFRCGESSCRETKDG